MVLIIAATIRTNTKIRVILLYLPCCSSVMGLPNFSPKVTIKNIATKTQSKIIINVILSLIPILLRYFHLRAVLANLEQAK